MEKDELFKLVAVLTAKNRALEERIKDYDEQLDIAVKKLNDCNDEIYKLELEIVKLGTSLDTAVKEQYEDIPDYDERYYPSMEEDARDVLDEIEEEKEREKYEAASRQAELEEAREEDDLFKDWTPPSYEDVVDPECDRGFDLGYGVAIGDMMNYLQDSKSYILIGDIMNYLQGLRDSK